MKNECPQGVALRARASPPTPAQAGPRGGGAGGGGVVHGGSAWSLGGNAPRRQGAPGDERERKKKGLPSALLALSFAFFFALALAEKQTRTHYTRPRDPRASRPRPTLHAHARTPAHTHPARQPNIKNGRDGRGPGRARRRRSPGARLRVGRRPPVRRHRAQAVGGGACPGGRLHGAGRCQPDRVVRFHGGADGKGEESAPAPMLSLILLGLTPLLISSRPLLRRGTRVEVHRLTADGLQVRVYGLWVRSCGASREGGREKRTHATPPPLNPPLPSPPPLSSSCLPSSRRASSTCPSTAASRSCACCARR